MKKNFLALFVTLFIIVNHSGTYAQLNTAEEMLCNRDQIKQLMERVAKFQIQAFDGKIIADWKVGTFYTGVFAAYMATGDTSFYYAAKDWCEDTKWKLTGEIFHADNICTGQTYLDFYLEDKDPIMIADVKSKLDKYFGKKFIEYNDLGNAIWKDKERPFRGRNLWWWCDALYMVPPVMARMYKATGDHRYLDLMDKLYWDTYNFLYDKKVNLFYRDSSAFDARTPEGNKVFWGRGNGWVYAGLIRILDYIPENDPMRRKYVELFRKMTRNIVKYQQPDGLWRSSLNDPSWKPEPETSCSSFFCYGLLGGINRGLIDRKSYLPVALTAWQGLLNCINTEGRMGYVQLVDGAPDNDRTDDFIDYAHGALLLAASELYKMNLDHKKFLEVLPPDNIIQLAKDGAWLWFNDPNIIVDSNAVYIGSIDSKGYTRVDLYQLKALVAPYAYQEYPLSSWAKINDHDYPSLLLLPNGNLLATYSKAPEKIMYYRIAEVLDRGTVTQRLKWGAEEKVGLNFGISHNNLIQLSPDTVLNLFSTFTESPTIIISDSIGKKWGKDFKFMSQGENHTSPYVKYDYNGRGRLDMLYTDGHPRNEPANSIYHIYFKNGNFYKSNGELICSLKEAEKHPISPEEGTKIYDGKSFGPEWVWDLEYDTNHNPVASFITSADSSKGKDLRYWYARWNADKNKWEAEQIAYAGSHLYVTENHFAGGITIDPQDVNTVYISADVDPKTGKSNNTGRYEIYKGKYDKSNKKWRWQQLTFDATVDNLRPIVPRHHGNKLKVVWFRGTYNSSADFKTEIVGIFGK